MNRSTFSDVPLLSEVFRWKDPKSRGSFTFQQDFQEHFVNGKRPLALESGIQVSLTENLESSTWNPESTGWIPEYQGCLGLLYMWDEFKIKAHQSKYK